MPADNVIHPGQGDSGIIDFDRLETAVAALRVAGNSAQKPRFDPSDRALLAALLHRLTKDVLTAPYREVQRARIVLAAADGMSNAGIARLLSISEDAVRTWRDRFVAQGTTGLVDRRDLT